MKTATIRAAAIQLETRIGDTQYNLQACKALAEQAVAQGAGWIALPEFFNSGVKFDPALVEVIEGPEGVSAQFLQRFSQQHQVVIGGSFMCRLKTAAGRNAGVRNRYLCFANGQLVGQHDKDLPTMWEAAYYEGGGCDDTGELGIIDDIRVGSALCWEFLRSQTARRLQGKIDVLIGGSHWWSLPQNWPAFLTRRMEQQNHENFIRTLQQTARLVGVPLIHASHCGTFESAFPSVPGLRYRGELEGHTAILDGRGNILAHRGKQQGQGFVIADIIPGYTDMAEPITDDYWLRRRGILPTVSWVLDGFFGRLWYKKHVSGQ